MKGGYRDETHLPAAQPAASSDPWVSQADVHSGGEADHRQAPRQGTQATLGLRRRQEVSFPRMERAGRSEDLRFPKAERLRSDREFREVVRKGERATTPHFTVYRDYRASADADRSPSQRKIGISVGRRVGGSVLRNRIKRILREFYRHHKEVFPEGSRTAIVAKKRPPGKDPEEIGRELLDAMTRRWGNKGETARCGRKHI